MNAADPEWVSWIGFWGNAASVGSFLLGCVAFILAGIALGYSIRQLVWARRSASVATVVSIDASLRQVWRDYLTSTEPARQRIIFGEVVNTWELACAIWEDGVYVGKAGRLMVDALCAQMKLVYEEPSMHERIDELIEEPENFEHIVRFIRAMKKQGRLTFIQTRAE